MPRNKEIKKVLVIGSGPIIIGQAAEFDYAGTQACRSLKEEGLEVVLLNSNPATIMTDKDIADRVYIEPLTVEVVEQLVLKEKPDSVLPTLGGQAALNLAMELEETFDAAVMIYCDYGVLPDHERRTLLRNLYNHLRPGGKVLLDVFSMESYRRFEELQTWETCPKGGFWKKEGYIALTGKYRCTDHVTLEQVTVIGERETKAYCLWNTYFTKEMLVREAGEAGFGVCGVLGDVAGSPCREDGPTIAILIEKQAG